MVYIYTMLYYDVLHSIGCLFSSHIHGGIPLPVAWCTREVKKLQVFVQNHKCFFVISLMYWMVQNRRDTYVEVHNMRA